MPKPVFDEIIHAPNRLRICAVLAAVAETEFASLRDTLGVADSVMSKHLKVLQDAGYVTLSKPTGAGRVRTWVTLTPTGRKAFQAHLAELQRLAGTTAPTPTPAHERTRSPAATDSTTSKPASSARSSRPRPSPAT